MIPLANEWGEKGDWALFNISNVSKLQKGSESLISIRKQLEKIKESVNIFV